ncbi:UNVERIFIED_CONTAM: hypothetical protein Sindi_1322300 [Sesamum indicum]
MAIDWHPTLRWPKRSEVGSMGMTPTASPVEARDRKVYPIRLAKGLRGQRKEARTKGRTLSQSQLLQKQGGKGSLGSFHDPRTLKTSGSFILKSLLSIYSSLSL